MSFLTKARAAFSSSAGKAGRLRALAPLAAGLTLTTAAVLFARHRMTELEAGIRREGAPVEIVVASTTIPAGTQFSEQNLAKKAVPAVGTGRRNVPAKDFELLLGASAKVEIAPGEPVLWTDVEEPYEVEKLSMAIPQGRRALSLSADPNALFGGLLHPGDCVDLLCESGEGSAGSWIRNVPVIAVDRHFTGSAPEGETADAATITLSVTPSEGRMIASANRAGRIHWFLRNPDDRTPDPPRPPSAPRPVKIEVWRGGRLQLASHPATGEDQ